MASASSSGASARSVTSLGLAAVKTVVEHGGKILRHAFHAPGADGFDARLLHRLEHRARLLPAGLDAAVHGGIVTGKPQRHGIGMPAHDGGFMLRQLARRFRQPRLQAARPGRSAAKLTSTPGFLAIARRQPATARLNGSAGDSFEDGFGF